VQKSPPPPAPKRRWRWLWLLAVVVVAVVVYYYWPQIKNFAPGDAAPPTAMKGRGKGGPIPVIAARVTKGNIRIYDTGLGGVTPIYTVTVQSRVTGQLMKVAFKEGQLVKEGDLLVEIDPRPYQVALDQAEGQLLHDEALLKNAHVDLDRYKILLAQQAIPEQQYATQEALVTQYEGTIKTDQAAIDNAKLNLVYCHITSPITGVVGLRLVDPGNIIQSTSTSGLVVITQIDPISVIFTVPEDQLPPVVEKIHAGQKLQVEAWDRENKNKLAQGTLETIDNQIDPTTGTVKLRAIFDNKAAKLFPSQFVNARLLVDQKHNVVLAPTATIQRNSQNTYVWLVKPDSSVTIRPVTTGTLEGDQTEITSGLAEGDEVVMVGVDKLQEGGRVNAQVPGEAPRNPNPNSGKGRGKKSS
jgi:multidrug efflux system membrane fusion protein